MSENERKIPPYVSIFTRHFPLFEVLSLEQKGTVFQYLIDFVLDKYGLPNNKVDIEKLNDPLVVAVLKTILPDTENLLNKYDVKSQNGKKGGAPKGNKNASKSKDTIIQDGGLALDKVNDTLISIYNELRYARGRKYNLEDDLKLNANQIADITSCIFLSGCMEFCEMGLKYENIDEYVFNENPNKLCKEAKEAAEHYYSDPTDNDVKKVQRLLGNKSEKFTQAFAECKSRVLKMQKMTKDEFNLFSKRCSIKCEPSIYEKAEIEECFTDEEILKYNLLADETNEAFDSQLDLHKFKPDGTPLPQDIIKLGLTWAEYLEIKNQ